MKFNIPTVHQLLMQRAKRLETEHKWFAWRPVRIDSDTIVWLQYVNRKCAIARWNGTSVLGRQYSLIEKE